jgi:signal transduction histidine kinase
MKFKNQIIKIIFLGVLALAITILHLATSQTQELPHIFYRELYFLPLILSSFWFGLRGSLTISLCVTFVYLPYTVFHWQSFSPNDLDRLLEIMLFNIVANGLGFLRDREKAIEKEKRKAIMAMAGTVAHEINSPLFSALGTSQLMQDEFNPGSSPHNDLKFIIRNLKEIKQMVKKISAIEDPKLKTYVGDSDIVDLEKSVNPDIYSN